ncbi:hypothetical protein EMIHUDRAFT_233434 [Emiliania huxleyi CCMP1516]|uniref:Helicase ATP-binding domain-containing protein n=2 Tax=Emiliania huxleyi TaxID=2903 RepID=A0A0D3K279_EMIH1|nr:hypothetical protein EMIHUDRAFT_233434 [Emiliania huxleyi CCMP1516]EOD29864.1 hypothetical protein EMIHUDRAFT_233434 [Emiliania huxleyi CCMP1516]|eukprot:XP_005782293.1 hypothetical protein EMIHUDRAFT_233434 [Emiliania huxleyi CCMP1516]
MRSSESDSDVSSGEAVTESGDTCDLGGLLDSLEGISLHQPREDGVPVHSGEEQPPFRFAVPAVQLRDYQASLLAAVRDRFSEGHGSVLAYLPTGGGKTHVAAAECASELAAGGRCLLLVNSRTLLEQTRRAFIKVGFGSELVGLVGGSSALQLERPVQVAMIQSLHGRTLEQHARWLRRFSLAVVDEAHAAFAHTYASLLRRLGEPCRVLGESCRVLGVTATPFRSSPEERLEQGFDLPEVGAVLLLRPTRSRRLYIQQVGRALRAAKGKEGCVVLEMAGLFSSRLVLCTGKEGCVVLDFAGLTWRFGPVYAWEEACGTAASARALVRRCRAAQSSCLASLSSSRAGLAAQPARHSAGQGGASRPVGQGEPSRALASTALPLGRSKHSAPEANPQQPRAAAQQMPKPRPASAPLPIAAASPPPQTQLHLRPASASSAARTPLADVFHERRQRHVYINEETGEMASTPPSGEACANALAAAVEALRVA